MITFLSRVWRAVLSALAHPPIFVFLMVGIVGTGATMSTLLLFSAERIKEEQKILEDQPFRNGFIAISDVFRVTNIADRIGTSGAVPEDDLFAFETAVDILFVRVDTFRNTDVMGPVTETEAAAVAALRNLVDLLDRALQEGFGHEPGFDYAGFSRDLRAAAEHARTALTAYLDQADHVQFAMLNKLSLIIERQVEAQVLFAVGLSALALVSLIVMRAEAFELRSRERAEARIRHMAYFDALTDLPNRVSFRETAERLLTCRDDCAVLLFDLDDFKGINDTLGHSVGDVVLTRIAARLKATVAGHGSIAARLSGDEFAALVVGHDRDALAVLGQRIVEASTQPIEVEGQTVIPGVSVGVSQQRDVAPSGEDILENMLRVADYALYISKDTPCGTVTISDAELMARYLEHRAIVEELPEACRNDRLEVHLQPKVLLDTRETHGFEALVRWRRDGKLISPASFIEVAEKNYLIAEIDLFVLRKAIRFVGQFNARNGTRFALSVNLSAVNLNSRQIVASVRRVLEDTGFPPSMLTLEVTETAMIANRGNAEAILGELRTLGVRISIDDFGAGHASLVYIRTLKPDEMKIDRSLIDGIETSAEARLVLDRMISVGLGLGINVVVEGLENEDHARIIAGMGCRIGQGYYLGRPEPAAEALEAALRRLGAIAEARERTLDSAWEEAARGSGEGSRIVGGGSAP